MTKASERVLDRVVLHLGDGERRVVDPADVYYLEAQDDDTLVRLRSARPLVDMRPIRELVPLSHPTGSSRAIASTSSTSDESASSDGGTTAATGKSNSSPPSIGCCR